MHGRVRNIIRSLVTNPEARKCFGKPKDVIEVLECVRDKEDMKLCNGLHWF